MVALIFNNLDKQELKLESDAFDERKLSGFLAWSGLGENFNRNTLHEFLTQAPVWKRLCGFSERKDCAST